VHPQRRPVSDALGFFTRLAGDDGVAWSGGSEIVRAADVVITMGCGDACPIFPGKRYVNWQLPDPAGQSVDAVRPIRDDIEQRVRRLLSELGISIKQ
jgi:arsenate reductase (thioredoxin)